eukprot:878916_1
MCAVRDEVATAEAAEAQAMSSSSNLDLHAGGDGNSMQPIDEDSTADQSESVSLPVGRNKRGGKDTAAAAATASSTATISRMSLTSMLWAHPQHLTNMKGTTSTVSGTGTRSKRSDSFSSVDSAPDPLDMSEYGDDFPPSFYANRPYFRPAVMEAIGEIMNDLEDLHKNIDEQ